MARALWLTKLLVRSGIVRFRPVARRLTDGGAAFLRYYSDKVLTAPVEELLDSAYFPALPADCEAIDLNLAAPRFESAVSLGRVAAADGRPPAFGLPELRGAITDLYVRRDGRAVDPEQQVLVTHGATAAYAAALDAFVNPGDRVVLFDPQPWPRTWRHGGPARIQSSGCHASRFTARGSIPPANRPPRGSGAGAGTNESAPLPYDPRRHTRGL